MELHAKLVRSQLNFFKPLAENCSLELTRKGSSKGGMVEYAIICGVGALISMVGDLAASAIKRNQGIKDYGKLIPGHGGILDRFDSVIFTAPIIYFLSVLLIH